MSYATQQDLIDRFGERELIELTDRAEPPAGTIDANVVAKALADADALVNSYIGRRYKVPIAEVPDVIRRAAADIARYYLFDDRPTEAVRRAYEDTVKFLSDISNGKAVLDVAGAEPEGAPSGIVTNEPVRTFTPDSLWDY